MFWIRLLDLILVSSCDRYDCQAWEPLQNTSVALQPVTSCSCSLTSWRTLQWITGSLLKAPEMFVAHCQVNLISGHCWRCSRQNGTRRWRGDPVVSSPQRPLHQTYWLQSVVGWAGLPVSGWEIWPELLTADVNIDPMLQFWCSSGKLTHFMRTSLSKRLCRSNPLRMTLIQNGRKNSAANPKNSKLHKNKTKTFKCQPGLEVPWIQI